MNTEFSVGNVLGTAFRIWFKNFIPFMLITALIFTPVIIWSVSSVQGEMTLEKLEGFAQTQARVGSLALLLNILASAALTYGVVMELQGQHASIGACIATGMGRFFPALGVALLSMLCIAGGFICLIVPGIILYCMLFVSTQASVLERPGILGALKRSRELTQGHKWQIFGLLFVLGILNFALQKVVEKISLPTVTPDTLDQFVKSMPKYVYIGLVEQVLVSSLMAVVASVAYYFLRAEREGTNIDELAAVFG
jgi:hypothetical protein